MKATGPSVGSPTGPPAMTSAVWAPNVLRHDADSCMNRSCGCWRSTSSLTNGGPYILIGSPLSPGFTNTGLINGTAYHYVVSAVGIGGESANSGQVSAMSSSTEPVEFSMSMTSGMVNITWPATHTGWRLQAQTNSLGTNWFTVSGSTETNLWAMPVDPASGSVFFRLIYP